MDRGDDHVVVRYMDLLPTELLVMALSHLSAYDLLRCMTVCWRFKNVIDTSLILQYYIALARNGAADNVCSTLLTAQKLKRLEAQERAWASLSPTRRDTIPIPRRFGTFDLCGGVLLGARAPESSDPPTDTLTHTPDSEDDDLNACEMLATTLPSVISGDVDVRSWSRNVGFPVYGLGIDAPQDLAVVIQSRSSCIESAKEGRFFDDFGFLTPDTVVLPVRKPGPATLDVYKFDTRKVARRSERLSRGSLPTAVRIATFLLPPMREPLEVSVNPICCNTEPPPYPRSQSAAPLSASASSSAPSSPNPVRDPPFYLDGSTSLLSFSFMVCHGHSVQSVMPLHERFTLVVQRKAFLSRIDDILRVTNGRWVGSQWKAVHVSWINWGPPISRWLTVKHLSWACFINGSRIVLSPIIPEDLSMCHLRVLDFNPYIVSKERQRKGARIAKENVGCCAEGGFPDKWKGRSKGKGKMRQRDDDIDEEEHQTLSGSKKTCVDGAEQHVSVQLVDEMGTIPSGKLWLEPVQSELPYRQVTTKDVFPFANVVIDEERIGGILDLCRPATYSHRLAEAMLDHLYTLFGRSDLEPVSLPLKDRALLLYATSDTITVIDAVDLSVVRVLAFWEAFANATDGECIISGLAVDRESRDDLILYTLTPDGTIRVFMPVLDDPHMLQLHATIDRYAFLPKRVADSGGSRVFWMDRDVVRAALESALQTGGDESDASQQRIPQLQQILDEGWDLFVRVLSDGSVVVRVLANLDRRPPTLLKQFTILHTPPEAVPSAASPSHVSIHFASVQKIPKVILLSSLPFRSFQLSALEFFNGHSSGIRQIARSWVIPHDIPRTT
ncbi:regulator of (H+)-ATPase in vacuolar membrane, partial [Tulasnella sp. 403]